ncbi:MAG: phenylalanine--tRNA ligase subunit beta [bacterium]
MKISYNWLKWYVPEVVVANKLADVFTYHLCEVESVETMLDGDTIFDLNILPNRAHDLLSHQGVARELSGQLGIKFQDPTSLYKIPASTPTKLAVDIQTPNCRRYMARIVRGVKIGPSPEWVVKHLASIGQRSINNVVDATNIVLFDCGQPTHAFDAKKLFSEKIVVRQANEDETMTTLDDKHVTLKPTDMVIADESEVLALAGVKGGTNAEVDDEHTTDIVLEVANFDPVSVRKTARRLNILTDAAKRFENDLSPEHCAYAMRELSATILEMCPDAKFEDVVDVYPKPQEPRTLTFSLLDVNKKLGSNLSIGEVEAILHRYGYQFTREPWAGEKGEGITLVVPALRLDLIGPHDMVEEIGRIYGYENIAPVIPTVAHAPKENAQYVQMCAARDRMLADGYSEVMTYAFTKKGGVEVARGAKGKEFLRTNLSDGLKTAYELNRLNAPLLGHDDTKIFEIGSVFPSLDGEEMHIAYADKKGVVESTLEAFTRELPLAPSTHVSESQKNGAKKFTPWSQYPFITRDVAVWVPLGTESTELTTLCKKQGTELLALEPRLFDQFTKGDKTSFAVRLVFQSHAKTLTDDEISPIMNAISSAIKDKGWEAR